MCPSLFVYLSQLFTCTGQQREKGSRQYKVRKQIVMSKDGWRKFKDPANKDREVDRQIWRQSDNKGGRMAAVFSTSRLAEASATRPGLLGSPWKQKSTCLPETHSLAPCSWAKTQNPEQERGDAESKPQHKYGRQIKDKELKQTFMFSPFSAVYSLTRVVFESAITLGISVITLPYLQGVL